MRRALVVTERLLGTLPVRSRNRPDAVVAGEPVRPVRIDDSRGFLRGDCVRAQNGDCPHKGAMGGDVTACQGRGDASSQDDCDEIHEGPASGGPRGALATAAGRLGNAESTRVDVPPSAGVAQW